MILALLFVLLLATPAVAQIANGFPGDVNICDPVLGHADCLLAETFEDTVAAVSNRFTGSSTVAAGFTNGTIGQSLNNAGMSLVVDAPAGSPGTRALQMSGIGGTNTGGHLFRNLTALCVPECTEIFVRYYVKYGSVTPYHHAGVWMTGQDNGSNFLPQTCCTRPPATDGAVACDASGSSAPRFYVGTEPGSGGDPPQSFDLYTGWQEMIVAPGGSNCYFGNTFIPNTQTITYNQWTLVELRIKMNTVGASDGEMQVWKDGIELVNLVAGLKGDYAENIFTPNPSGADTFPGFRWRSASTLTTNGLWLNFLVDGLAMGNVATMRLDHLVLARSRVGALVPTGGGGGSGTVNLNSTTTNSGTGTTASVTHVPAGANRLLTATVTRDATATVSSCTFNGSEAMTFIAATTPSDGFGRTEKWYRLNPTATSGTVSCTLTSSTAWVIGARSYTGVLQTMSTSDFNYTAATPATSTAPSVTITTAANQMVEDGLGVSITAAQTATVGPGQTSNYNTTLNGQVIGAGSTETGSPTSTVMSWTTSASLPWAIGAIRILPTGTADTTPPSAPSNVTTSALTTTTTGFTCTAATDNVGVVNYRWESCSTAACTSFVEYAQTGACANTHTGLTANTLYRHRVRAWDGTNFGAYSSIVDTTTLTAQTLFVRFVDQQPDGTDQETGFVINRKVPGGAWAQRTITAPSSGSGSTVTFQDTTAERPESCYQVAANNNVGTSSFTGGDSGVCFTASASSLGVTPITLTYTATVGGSNPAAQPVTVQSLTTPGMNWTVADDAAWLNCLPASGTDGAVLSCAVSLSGLTSGTYLSTITVTASGAVGSPKTVTATLNLSPATTPGGTTPGSSHSGRVR